MTEKEITNQKNRMELVMKSMYTSNDKKTDRINLEDESMRSTIKANKFTTRANVLLIILGVLGLVIASVVGYLTYKSVL